MAQSAVTATKMTQEKVRKAFPDKNQEEVFQLAKELTNRDEIMKKFKHLLNYVEEVVEEVEEQNRLLSGFHSIERDKAREAAKHGVANVCHLPVKLHLSKLERQWTLSHAFTSLLRYEYGPLHAALEVGNITLEWGQEGLVIPAFEPSGSLFAAHVHDQGEWFDETYKLVKSMSLADRRQDRKRKIEILNNSAKRKVELLQRLADVIVDYNSNKKYSVFSCNCQHFVLDALAALGIKEPPEFSGRLKEYFKSLKKGKPLNFAEFKTHELLDECVARKLRVQDMTNHDSEFLLCQYFQFHLPSIEASEDEDEWQCEVPNCQCAQLEEWVKDRALLLNQFLENKSQLPAIKEEEEEYVYEAPPRQKDVEQNGVGNGHAINGAPDPGGDQDDESEQLARQLAGDTDQAQLLARHSRSGYSERISRKIDANFPNKSQAERSELAKVLVSQEEYRAKYFAEKIDKVAEQLTLSASNDYKRAQSNQLPPSEARRLSMDRFQAASNFSIKLLLRTQPQQAQGSILKAPLQAYLHIENLVLYWDESNLIIPVEASTFLASQPVYKASLHLNDWSAFVSKQEPKRDSAINQSDGGLEVQLIIDLNTKRDKILLNLLGVVVDYNRNKSYHDRTCNNQHFIRDACRAVGVKPVPDISKTFDQQISKLNPSRRLKRTFRTHKDLDRFVREEIGSGKLDDYKSYDLDFLIGQYFRFHITSWDESERPQGQWVCPVENCQLEELEKRKPKVDSSWCVLL